MNYEGLLGFMSKLMYELSATSRRRTMLFTLKMSRQGENDHFIKKISSRPSWAPVRTEDTQSLHLTYSKKEKEFGSITKMIYYSYFSLF